MSTRRLAKIIMFLSFFKIGLTAPTDPDLWWHLKTGGLIAQNGIPRYDPFSFTSYHHPWVVHEWLSQLFLHGLYLAGGLPLIVLWAALLFLLIFSLLYKVCEGRPYAAILTCVLAAQTAAIAWSPGPKLFTYLFCAIFIFILEKFRQGKLSASWLTILPFLSLVWVNLHPGYFLGLVIEATYLLGSFLDVKLKFYDGPMLSNKNIRLLALATAASGMAALVNPYGYKAWLYSLTMVTPGALKYITEWQSPDFHESFLKVTYLLMMGACVFTALFSQRKISMIDTLLFFGTAGASLISVRHIPVFAIVNAPMLARHTKAFFQNKYADLVSEDSSSAELVPSKRQMVLNILIAGSLLAVFFVKSFDAIDFKKIENAIEKKFPVGAAHYIKSHHLDSKRGYNNYDWGGFLIWNDIPVFIDGRSEMYGDKYLSSYFATFSLKKNWRRVLDKYKIDYVVLSSGHALSRILEIDSHWRKVYRDKLAEVFIRQ